MVTIPFSGFRSPLILLAQFFEKSLGTNPNNSYLCCVAYQRTVHFAVDSLSGGDVAIGFRDYAWHTHADMLASIRGLPESEAVRSYIDDVLNDRAVIAMQYIDGDLRDIWVSDNPNGDLRCQRTHRISLLVWRYVQFAVTSVRRSHNMVLPQGPQLRPLERHLVRNMSAECFEFPKYSTVSWDG